LVQIIIPKEFIQVGLAVGALSTVYYMGRSYTPQPTQTRNNPNHEPNLLKKVLQIAGVTVVLGTTISAGNFVSSLIDAITKR